MRFDARLRRINSSVAEGAHATIGKIRKSLSFMNEAHAIIFTSIAIHAWNREKLIAMFKPRREAVERMRQAQGIYVVDRRRQGDENG